jgi:hypothetical protein
VSEPSAIRGVPSGAHQAERVCDAVGAHVLEIGAGTRENALCFAPAGSVLLIRAGRLRAGLQLLEQHATGW